MKHKPVSADLVICRSKNIKVKTGLRQQRIAATVTKQMSRFKEMVLFIMTYFSRNIRYQIIPFSQATFHVMTNHFILLEHETFL